MEIFFCILILVVIIVVFVYNNLIRLRNMVNNSFSSIDVILNKRYDLIPNLIDTVKEYTNYEEHVFESLTDLRAQALNNKISIEEKIKLDKNILTDLDKIFVISEKYPELKASQNFIKLQTAIIDIEDELAAARRSYNASVTEYNINIKVFPNNIFANKFGFREISLFEAKDIVNTTINLR